MGDVLALVAVMLTVVTVTGTAATYMAYRFSRIERRFDRLDDSQWTKEHMRSYSRHLGKENPDIKVPSVDGILEGPYAAEGTG